MRRTWSPMRRSGLAALIVLAVVGAAGTAARGDKDAASSVSQKDASHKREGGWKRPGDDAAAPNHKWTVDLKRGENGVLTGRMNVVGHSRVRGANLKGTLVGMEVSGILTDDHGKQIGTFKGNVTPTGAEGDFTENNGQTGAWTWQRPVH